MWRPTLSLTIILPGRPSFLNSFPYLFRSLISEALHLPLGLRSQDFEDLYVLAFQLPNPMFVFAFEGALFALTYNGDRFVLFALLPRRKPRTSVSAAALLFFKELNLTGSGYSDSHVPFGRRHGFCFVQRHRCFFLTKGAQPSAASFRRRCAPLFSASLYSTIRTTVPNPMLVLAYEGALLA